MITLEEFPELGCQVSPIIAKKSRPNTQIERRTPSTYADMVNRGEGLSLMFVEAFIVNGTRCAKIEHQDVAAEIEFWNQAMICSVLGPNPLLGFINSFVRRIWNQHEIDKVVAACKGVYLDKEAVLSKGIYYFDHKPFIVKAWNENLEVDTNAISSLPIWYWGVETLSKLGSILGIPLKTDKPTMEKNYLNYAGLLINISLDGPFPEYVDYITDKGIVT
ncbi:hypothetical protein Cgig2_013407 [Carnegiea gigantea]|uniref:DUF4283 domain-containing protein n=1 Tax=Carnegiea gigantea TaxID=171969 RepID=A0A9Q1JEA6_9CARY|nr:hypothetical protein Cgig2_013407 [Carnegiea gigantea]